MLHAAMAVYVNASDALKAFRQEITCGWYTTT